MTMARILMAGLLAAGFAVISLLAALPAHAQETVVIQGQELNGFGRIRLAWPEAVEVEETVTNGVLVLEFSRPFEGRLSDLPVNMPNYVALARQDPSGKTMRIALKFPFRVETLTAANEVYVNLVPDNWAKALPGLPQEVIAREEAAREAREKAEAARRALAMAELVEVPVRVGVHPSYSRLVFDWPREVNYTVTREGAKLTLGFDKPGKLKVGRLRVDPPPFVVDAKADSSLENAKLDLVIAPEAEFRIFREGSSVVLDLTAANEDAGGLAELAVQDDAYKGRLPSDAADPYATLPPDGRVPPRQAIVETEAEAEVSETAQVAAAAGNPAAAPAKEKAGGASVTMVDPRRIGRPETPRIAKDSGYAKGPAPEGADASVEGEEADAATEAHEGQADHASEADDQNAADETTVAAAQDSEVAEAPDAEDTLDEPATGDVADLDAPEAVKPLGPPGSVKVTRVNDGVRFAFPGLGDAPAVVFERAGYVWALFETDVTVEAPKLTTEHAPYVDASEPIGVKGLSGVRLRTTRDALVTARHADGHWEVSVGDTVLDTPTALKIRRGVRADGGGKFYTQAPDAGRTYRITDPEIGDNLALVPLPAPVRGVLSPAETVDLEVLPSAQGLAFRPIADDVNIATSPSGEVSATRSAGLMLTPDARRTPAASFVQRPLDDPTSYGTFDLPRVAGEDFHLQLAQLNAAAASAKSADELKAARLSLARFYLGHELGSEALGVLRLVAEADETIIADPSFLALRAMGHYMNGQYELAIADLDQPALTSDPNAAMWRVMTRARLGQYVQARPDVGRARAIVGSNSPRWQIKFNLAAAEVALGVNDVTGAEAFLQEVPEKGLGKPLLSELVYLQGRRLEAAGDNEAALSRYAQAVAEDYRPVAARALLAQTRLAHDLGAMPAQEAIDALDRLRFTWRGGPVELQAAAALADIYEETGDYRAALTVMRDVVTQFPRAEKGREVADKMADLFRRLFLEGEVDSLKPLDALSLFYDFRELTPVGRDGDRMIRELADRLVAVDLLDQAAEMLDHQVTYRLRGAARAQVASRLAAIHLLNREPDEALTALRKTRQAGLPAEVAAERRLLEAQALSALQRYDHALEIIADDKTDPARSLRADILWAAGDYAAAGRALEDLLGLSWTSDEPLEDAEQFDVLRAAIAYVLANETEGVERVRQKFAEKMTEGPRAASFAIVASSSDGRGIAFRDLAREIAQVDMLNRFMDGYRTRYEAAQDAADAANQPS